MASNVSLELEVNIDTERVAKNMEEVKDRFGGLYRQYIVNKSDQQESSIAIYGNDDECFELPDLPLEIREGVDLQTIGKELGIKYFLVSYSTLNTSDRCSLIPIEAIRKVQREGCGMSSAMFFDTNGSMPEMYIVPDPLTLSVLPWKKEYAWLSSNLYIDGKPFAQCPRMALQRVIHRASRLGYRLMSGIER